jgi:hypothetical protein
MLQGVEIASMCNSLSRLREAAPANRGVAK